MKRFQIFLFCAIAFGISTLLGCSNFQSSSISDYYSVQASSTSDNSTIYYSVASVDNSIATGYSLSNTLPVIDFSLTSLAKDNYKSITLPSIHFTSMKVTYSVVGDSKSVIGTWTPSTLDTGISVVIPGATSSSGGADGAFSSSVSATLNNIASTALANQVFTKIGTVTSTLNGSGAYVFGITLSTDLTVRADVILTGKDDRDKDVTLPFSTTISFAKKAS